MNLKEKIKKQYMKAIVDMNKEIMLMLEDNKASTSIHVKNKIISYYICNELLGCKKSEFNKATGLIALRAGISEKGAFDTITTLDKLMIKEIKKQLNEKDFSITIDTRN